VVLAVLIIVLVSLVGKTSGPNGNGSQPCPANVCGLVTHVPRSSFAAAGSTLSPSGPFLQGIYALKDKPLLKSGGKPLVIYLGSEYCPYCAATRWPLTVALSRFGTFKGLAMTASSSTDVDPSTNTLSYYGSTYSSPYIAFSPTEECTNIRSTSTSAAVQDCSGYLPLQTPTRAIAKVFGVYDFPPYVPNSQLSPGGIPFVDFGNQFHEDGAFIDPAILAGRTHLQIAESLSNPVASPGQTILVGANYYSALICKLTGNKPATICQMPAVRQAAATIDKKGSLGTP